MAFTSDTKNWVDTHDNDPAGGFFARTLGQAATEVRASLVGKARLLYNITMDTCLECHAKLARLDNQHLAVCCGLTLQEYAIRYGLPLDVVVPRALLDYEPPVSDYPEAAARASREARIVLAAVQRWGCSKRGTLGARSRARFAGSISCYG